MSTSVFIVHTNAKEGREEEFNDWYNNQHLSDVVAIPNFVRARRYRLSDAQFTPYDQFRYFAIYEIGGDPQEAMDALRVAVEGGMYLSEAMAEELFATVYDPITEWVTHDGAAKVADGVAL